jgi:hypothetical protein
MAGGCGSRRRTQMIAKRRARRALAVMTKSQACHLRKNVGLFFASKFGFDAWATRDVSPARSPGQFTWQDLTIVKFEIPNSGGRVPRSSTNLRTADVHEHRRRATGQLV